MSNIIEILTQLQALCDDTEIKRQALTLEATTLRKELKKIDNQLFFCKIDNQDLSLTLSQGLDNFLKEPITQMLSNIENYKVPVLGTESLKINVDTNDESLQIMNELSNLPTNFTIENVNEKMKKVFEEIESLTKVLAEYADRPQSTEAYKNEQQQKLEQKLIDINAQEIKLEEFKALVAKYDEILKPIKDKWEQSQNEIDELQQQLDKMTN